MGQPRQGTTDAKSPDAATARLAHIADTGALRRETEAILEGLVKALDDAKLKAESVTRFAVEILSGTVRHSTALLCTLVDEVRGAGDDLAALLERQSARQKAVIKVLHLWGFAIVATNLVILGVVTASMWPSHAKQPSLIVDFETGGTGLVHCGAGARDATGAYHCSMDIVLKKNSKDR